MYCISLRLTLTVYSENSYHYVIILNSHAWWFSYGRGNSLRWPRNTLYPQMLALTSPRGGRSVGIVRLRTTATEFTLGGLVRGSGWVKSDTLQLVVVFLWHLENWCFPSCYTKDFFLKFVFPLVTYSYNSDWLRAERPRCRSSSPGRVNNFSPRRPDRFWGPPNGYWGSFPEGKAAEA
jgi:hypothetical protein